MLVVKLDEENIKYITKVIVDNKMILHPKISPEGIPNFNNYLGKDFILILDRNLLTKIIKLVTDGGLKDAFSLKIISSLLFWAEFNGIRMTSGQALVEYSHYHQDKIKSSQENNIFKEIFKQCHPKYWLELALEKRNTIPPVVIKNQIEYNFFVEDEHFKMHYLEMLKLSQLYFSKSISIVDKMRIFHEWVFENILICKYTTFFSAILFAEKSKIYNNQQLDFDKINKTCINQAWDLTYLSFWSTLYYFEDKSDKVYLFATHDKELKELFFITHEESTKIFIKYFGEKMGNEVVNTLNRIIIKRDKPEINFDKIEIMTTKEIANLKKVLNERV